VTRPRLRTAKMSATFAESAYPQPMPSNLKAYRAKRNFTVSPEPAGQLGAGVGNRFVVHKHAATADHYDLRLEYNGVLKSWAVPKGPSLNPDDKRLAVETEDHPVDYIDFEGVIPEGEYGGGPMIVWDTGTWAPMDDVEKALKTGAFKFRLAGEKLNGGWMLARLKPKAGEDANKHNWLLFKEHDLASEPSIDILAARPESVKSGKRIEELVAPPPKPAKAAKRPAKPKPGALAGAVEAPMASRIEPQLASPAAAPPTGGDWLHEIKFDGYRTLALLRDGNVELVTRSGLDWTKRYGDLGAAFAALPVKTAAIDGEIVVLDEHGISRFGKLQEALGGKTTDRLVFYAFDLVYLDGFDLSGVKLMDRKNLLETVLAGHVGGSSAIQFSDHVAGEGQALYDRAAEIGLEGIVSKRGDSGYHPGRSTGWVKSKALKTGDFVIAGYTPSAAAGGLGALAVAEWVDGELAYRGKVGTGFDAATLKDLLNRLRRLEGEGTPLAGGTKDTIWVRPVLTARIHYGNLTSDGFLRHAVFKGLREAELSAGPAVERKRLISDADLAQVWVTNPTRRLFGAAGPTKLDIAVYYALVGDYMLPHLLGRPVSMVRCPTGKPADCFFQRHAFTGMPATVVKFETENSEGETQSYLTIEDAKGFLALAQFGVVEFHTWGTEKSHLATPDRIVFDLDPGEGIGWREMVEAASHVGHELSEMGLVPFVKTSGGKGIHVVVPIVPKLDWKAVHAATGAIAAHIAAGADDTFTTTQGAQNRKRKIFIDFHRNARSATSAAPYTLRARTGVAASTPLSWDDLDSIDSPADLNYSSLPGLLTTSGDPWAEIKDSARELPKKLQLPAKLRPRK
jgi:bifunctional non-homologous end joining protein LigD